MEYKVSPLLYGAHPGFCSAFRLAFEMTEPVDAAALRAAVSRAMVRYPYFAVRVQYRQQRMVLRDNPLPVQVFSHDRTVTLGTAESNHHLLAFACSGHTLYLDCSHFLADGMGIFPLVQTVLCLYLKALHPDAPIDTGSIRMPEDPVPPAEWAYPFPEVPMACSIWKGLHDVPEDPYVLDPAAFDDGGLYAYHLHIDQTALMKTANTSDASPVSFLSTMLFRALCSLEPGLEKPVVGHVQHQYRAALNTPQSHHSLVCYVPIVFTGYLKSRPLYTQNTAIRGQVILRSDEYIDIENVNRLLRHFSCVELEDLAAKKAAMQAFVRRSVRGKTFGISYMGRVNWMGMDAYIRDIHAYIGEKNNGSMLLMEVMALRDVFSVTFMQSGKGTRYLNAFLAQLAQLEIPARIHSQGRYRLCDTQLPD